jgi:hypothetical protein
MEIKEDDLHFMIRTLERGFSDDILDPEAYPDLIGIESKILNHYNSRSRENYFGNIIDNGISVWGVNEFTYLIICANDEKRDPYRKLYYEIGKMILRLTFYNILRISNSLEGLKDTEIHCILNCISNRNRPEEIKNFRAYNVRKIMKSPVHLNKGLLDKSKLAYLFKYVDFETYDDFIHEDYLMNWKIDPLDYEESFKEPEGETPEEYKYFLRKFMRRVVHGGDLVPSDIEIGEFNSNSTSYSQYRTYKSHVREEPVDTQQILGQPFSYERVVIYVSPANARDSWRADPETLNQLKYFGIIFRKLANMHPKSGMCNEKFFQDRLERILKKDGINLMLDFKKAGLTIPRHLIRDTVQIMSEFAELDVLTKYVSAFDNTSVKVNGRAYRPKRGFGLGMGNELMTLICCICADTMGVDGIFYSDDGIYKIDDENQRLDIERFYLEVGWPLNQHKPIMSVDRAVFLEEYYLKGEEDPYFYKEIREVMPYVDFIFSENIWEVKEKFCNYNRAFPYSSQIMRTAVKEFYDIFMNSEFDSDLKRSGNEEKLPLEYGGWEVGGYTSTSNIGQIFLKSTSYDKQRIQNILSNYEKFNQTVKVRYKSWRKPFRKYYFSSENSEAMKIEAEKGFSAYYNSIEDNLNSMEISSAKSTKIKKIKGIKTRDRYKIWNDNVPRYLSDGAVLLYINILDKVKIPHLQLIDEIIESIELVKSSKKPGKIQRVIDRDVKPYEASIAYAKFFDIPYSTNYKDFVTPCYIRDKDDIELKSYSFNGFIPERREFPEVVLKELTKLSKYPEVVLAEYCVRKEVFVLDLKLKIPDRFIKDIKEVPISVIGSGDIDMDIPPYTFRLPKNVLGKYYYILERYPGIRKLLSEKIANIEKNKKMLELIEQINRISDLLKERERELTLLEEDELYQADTYFITRIIESDIEGSDLEYEDAIEGIEDGIDFDDLFG